MAPCLLLSPVRRPPAASLTPLGSARMAPVPVSPPSAPSGVSTVFATIGDREQIIVYAAIVVVFFAVFLFAVICILRIYNASGSEDEELNTTATPRPPLRLLLPGKVQQRTASSTSTLIASVTTPGNLPTPAKREGSVPSPLVCDPCRFPLLAADWRQGSTRSH